MHSNLPLPKLLEIISRIVNDSGCTVRIVDEIPVQDREIRELCLQIYELRRAAQSIAHGELGVHFENCGCMATYLKDIMDRLKAVERGIKELAEGDTPELPRLGALGTYFELIGNTLQENRRLIEKYRNLFPDRHADGPAEPARLPRAGGKELCPRKPQAAEHFLYHGGHRSFQEGQRPARP